MRISVIISVRNGARFLDAAMRSILDQSLREFELLVMDDGSTDETAQLLNSYSDPRIRRLRNEPSQGLAKSLNALVSQASGAYIARMDADDIAEPDRLSRQKAFLDSDPDVGIVGTSATMIDDHDKIIGSYAASLTHGGIKWRALFSNPMIHPSVMGRAEIFRRHPYDETYANSQDYALWSRLLFTTDTRFANLPAPLLRYRIHPASTTRTRDGSKQRLSLETSLRNISRYVTLDEPTSAAFSGYRMGNRLRIADARLILKLFDDAYRVFLARETLTADERNEVTSLYRRNKRSVYTRILKQLLGKS